MPSLQTYLDQLSAALSALDHTAFDAMVAELERVQREDKFVYICGNGGSAASASHMINDIVKAPAFATGCRPIRAVGLADCIPLMTALANDVDYAHMFSKQLEAYGRPGDVLIAISASGNSPNIIEAAKVAQDREMTIIGMTGFNGGKLHELADIKLHVPSDNYGVTEDAHMILQHAMIEVLKESLRGAPQP